MKSQQRAALSAPRRPTTDQAKAHGEPVILIKRDAELLNKRQAFGPILPIPASMMECDAGDDGVIVWEGGSEHIDRKVRESAPNSDALIPGITSPIASEVYNGGLNFTP